MHNKCALNGAYICERYVCGFRDADTVDFGVFGLFIMGEIGYNNCKYNVLIQK